MTTETPSTARTVRLTPPAAPPGPQPGDREADGIGRRCWSCRSVVTVEPNCPECGKLQPPHAGTDYFAVFGLPRRLQMDLDALEQDFHALSRRFHPDRFRTGLPRERVIALDHASLVNRGYRTLREPFERAAYLLKIEEGAGIEGNGSPPQELFEEILELQELLAEYRFAESDEQSRLKPRLVEMRCELEAVRDRGAARLIGPLFADWDAGARDRPVLLAEMRTILNERAYLRRALDSLAEVLSRS